MNINEEGFPLTREEIEAKFGYQNFNPLKYEVVKGHLYAKPENDPETEDPQSEFESRRQERLKRRTHETVVIPRVQRSKQVPPSLLPKPSADPESEYSDVSSRDCFSQQLSRRVRTNMRK